jgi:SAM-dependent methyltransferase/uncharacterized protein YbaR (Trm112 family)
VRPANVVDPELLDVLRCPDSGQPLRVVTDKLVSADGSRVFPIVDGIPCIMPRSVLSTHQGYRTLLEENGSQASSVPMSQSEAAGFVRAMIVSTCGNLFKRAKLDDAYPIPEVPAELSSRLILDVGCNWGRWSIAAAKAGRRVIGIDIHLRSLLAARSISWQLAPKNEPLYVLGDGRSLPFAPTSFDGVFSYSCIQHFSKEDASKILSELHRVMKPHTRSVIQMPNRAGIRSRLNLTKRRYAEGIEFDVRYYSIEELLSLFGSKIGKSEFQVDCFFGLNVHKRDRSFISPGKRWIVYFADLALRASQNFPPFRNFSDSVFIISTKN